MPYLRGFSGVFLCLDVCAAAVDAAVLGRFWASWAQKRTPTAADAPDLKLFVKSGPFPPEMFRFPVETTAFPDVSRVIPSFPAFLNYVVPVQQCTKKAVRQLWIEDLVLQYVIKLVQDEELLEFIAENTYQYYLAQSTDTTYTKSLQKALADTEKSIANLLRAIEAGIFNESTKDRMNELEEQKKELRVALAAAKLKEDLGLKKEHIVFFLHQFAGMDYSDVACQKRLIKTFLNSVFVYDDKVVMTFNYSGDRRTITLKEIDAGLQQGIRIPRAVVHQTPESSRAFRGFRIF